MTAETTTEPTDPTQATQAAPAPSAGTGSGAIGGSALLPIADRATTARVAWRLTRSRKLPLAGAIASFVMVGLCAMVPPWMLGRIVDAVGAGERSITAYVVAIAVAALGGAVFTALSVALVARAGEPALAELREDVLDRALSLDTERLEAAGAGDLLSRVGDDSRKVAESLNSMVPTLVNSALVVAFIAVGMLALDWRLGLAGLVALPFYVIGLRWYLPRSAPVYREERVAQGERAGALVGGLRGAATLRAFGHEGGQLRRIEESSQRARGLSVHVFGLLTRFFARTNRAELIGLAAVLGVGFWLVRADEASVGAVTAAALYFHRMFNPIGSLLLIFDQVQAAGASLARLVGVTLIPPAAPGAPGPERPGPLELSGVGHAYVPGQQVLAPTDLTIAVGERVAVVGTTGAGKSTLGAIAGGVLTPSAGSVRLAGASYADLGPATIRERVALVSQDVYVLAGPLRDNVTLVRPDATDAEVLDALDQVFAGAWVRTLPDGLDTVVGDGGHALTPAQAQQIALARLLLADPWFVVLDEATAEAGSAGARDLERAAEVVTRGRGALVVAHRLTQSESADRVLVLHDGLVVEHGTHAELLARGGRYAELWAAWST